MPFCNLRLRAARRSEFPRGYPQEVRTLGDQLRRCRLDLGLTQRILAPSLGVSVETLALWEKGRARPLPRHYSAVVRFLGRDPEPAAVGSGARFRAVRRRLGLTQAEAARRLGLDEGTVGDFERGRRQLSRRVAKAVANLQEE